MIAEPYQQLNSEMTEMLAAEVRNARALLDAINDESHYLAVGGFDDVEKTSQVKLDLARDIERLISQRNRALELRGFARGREGIAQLTDHGRQDCPIAALWAELRELAAQCQAGNQHVGSLIRRRKQAGELALQILRRGTIESPSLYNPSGNIGERSMSRTLGRA